MREDYHVDERFLKADVKLERFYQDTAQRKPQASLLLITYYHSIILAYVNDIWNSAYLTTRSINRHVLASAI